MNEHTKTNAALILETNNLRGAEDLARQAASLARLLRHLRAQTLPLGALAEVVITHDGLDDRAREALERAAERAITFVRIPDGAGYYEAKNLGFGASRADVVVFGDSDCWPDPWWLAEMVAPFADPAMSAVAGRTTYRDDVLGAAATAIDFMYFPTSFGADCTRNFYANNVAFRREVFARFGYRAAPDIYRGHCQQLGARLHAARVPIHFAPRARTVHRFPDSAREFVRLRMLRGADTVAMAPVLARTALPRPLDALGGVPVVAPLGVLAARLALSARAINHQDLVPRRGVARAAAVAGVVGISLLDAAGAMARATGLTTFGVRDGSLTGPRLGYHGNVDGLREGAGSAHPQGYESRLRPDELPAAGVPLVDGAREPVGVELPAP